MISSIPMISREDFLELLREFFASSGLAVDLSPEIMGHPIDLFALYTIVAARGGYSEACSRKGSWREICRSLPNCPVQKEVPKLVKKCYKRLLLPFERICAETCVQSARTIVKHEPTAALTKSTDSLIKRKASTLTKPADSLTKRKASALTKPADSLTKRNASTLTKPTDSMAKRKSPTDSMSKRKASTLTKPADGLTKRKASTLTKPTDSLTKRKASTLTKPTDSLTKRKSSTLTKPTDSLTKRKSSTLTKPI
eukprot:23611_1